MADVASKTTTAKTAKASKTTMTTKATKTNSAKATKSTKVIDPTSLENVYVHCLMRDEGIDYTCWIRVSSNQADFLSGPFKVSPLHIKKIGRCDNMPRWTMTSEFLRLVDPLTMSNCGLSFGLIEAKRLPQTDDNECWLNYILPGFSYAIRARTTTVTLRKDL